MRMKLLLFYVFVLGIIACNNDSSPARTGSMDTILIERKVIDANLVELRKKARAQDSIYVAEGNQLFKNSFKANEYKGNFTIKDSADLKFAIDTMALGEIYNDAMWRIYCIRCDRKVKYGTNAKTLCGLPDSLTYGEMNLELTTIEKEPFVRNPHWKVTLPDSIPSDYGLWFTFSYNHSKCRVFEEGTMHDQSSESSVELFYSKKYPHLPLFLSLGSIWRREFIMGWFDPKAKKIIDQGKLHDRIFVPLQPEVIYYIRTHADKIDPWFRREAITRGVFDSLLYPPASISKQIKRNKRDHTGQDPFL
jgi:hypothetical protein